MGFVEGFGTFPIHQLDVCGTLPGPAKRRRKRTLHVEINKKHLDMANVRQEVSRVKKQ